jgi:hypothetical protein
VDLEPKLEPEPDPLPLPELEPELPEPEPELPEPEPELPPELSELPEFLQLAELLERLGLAQHLPLCIEHEFNMDTLLGASGAANGWVVLPSLVPTGLLHINEIMG